LSEAWWKFPRVQRCPASRRCAGRAGPASAWLVAALLLAGASVGWCQTAPDESVVAASSGDTASTRGALGDIEAYFTAPLHWTQGEWMIFGGALAGIGVANIYDKRVRAHFVRELGPSGSGSDDLQDAIPTAAVLVGNFAFATLIDDSAGKREAWSMFEAAGLSTLTAYGLKFAIRREGPDETNDPNAWASGHGGTFPSTHATAAFAVGTVLAESGNDDYRWLRRFLGYGLGVATDYERLKHNAHWLSDVVAGSALGAASAYFVIKRRERSGEMTQLMLVPMDGGAELTFKLSLR
jgi:membrane-associated phospholipid phosphatase